jgi:hypothetical protein
MSAIALGINPSVTGRPSVTGQFVQHTFDWDAPAPSIVLTVKPAAVATAPSAAVAASTVATASTVAELSIARTTMASSKPNQPARRGKCEHVGSVMGTVLAKYGLGVDDLLRAIEEQRASAPKPR